MTQIYHQNNFGTALTSNVNAGDTTSPLNSIPSISAPFYIAFDATNVNGHYEVRQITSKTATNVLHSALTYPHTTAEEVRMVVPAEEMDDISARLNAGDYFYSGMARQAIMNGNFDVWQRGTSASSFSHANYQTADRWQYLSVSGGVGFTQSNLQTSKQSITPGDIANSSYFFRLAPTTSISLSNAADYIGIQQSIENGTAKLCGLNKKVTISFWARSSISNKKIGVSLEQKYGSGGSPTSSEQINGSNFTLTSTWTKYTVTFTTNTIVGKTFGTNADDALKLQFYVAWNSTVAGYVGTGSNENISGSGNIDIAQVQLCAGDVALPFQPKSIEEELRACQRYYEKNQHMFARAAGSVFMGGTIFYKVSKRYVITPSFTDTIGNASRVSIDASNNIVVVAGGIANQTTEKFEFDANLASGAGNWSRIVWTADAEL